MVQFECPRVIYPLVSFTFGVHCGVSISLYAGKGKCCMWPVNKVEIHLAKIGFMDCKFGAPSPSAADRETLSSVPSVRFSDGGFSDDGLSDGGPLTRNRCFLAAAGKELMMIRGRFLAKEPRIIEKPMTKTEH